MKSAAVSFCWTLPVPWAGFAALPEEINAAAAQSRTIRYQRDLIQRHAKDQHYRLVHEAVFLEIAPDRGSDLIQEALKRVEVICRAEAAVLLMVDFSEVQGWRSHAPLTAWSDATGIELETLYPDELVIDGITFDPSAHFAQWRDCQQDWTESKPARTAHARACAEALREEGLAFPKVAQRLCAQAVPSLTGRPWTADMVRKVLKAAGGKTEA